MCQGSTGSGLTVTFTDFASTPANIPVGRIQSVQLPEWLTEVVDFSGLDSSFTCKKSGDLLDLGEALLQLFWDAKLTIVLPGTRATMLVTFPISSGGDSQATLSATGFFRSHQFPNAAVNDPMIRPIAFVLDGEDEGGMGPSFVVETDSP